MNKHLSILLLVVLLLALAAPAYAQGGTRDGLVSFGQNIVVRTGEIVQGDVVSFGGNIVVETKARVDGNLVSFGGNIANGGEIAESIVAFGGNVDLLAGSLVRQDVLSFGGNVNKADGATVMGNVNSGMVFGFRGGSSGPRVELPGTLGTRGLGNNLLWSLLASIFKAILTVLVLVALVMIIVALFPQPVEGVKETLVAQPLPSLGVGCLTYLAAAALTIPLLITCIGPFLMWPVIFVVSVFGLAALGLWVGERVTTGIKTRQTTPLLAAAMGTFLIVAVLAAIDVVPFVSCFGWIFWLLVASLSLGAVILHKFGAPRPGGGSLPMPPAAPALVAPIAPTPPVSSAMEPIAPEPPAAEPPVAPPAA